MKCQPEQTRDKLLAEADALAALIATCEHDLHQSPIGCPYCKRDTRLMGLLREAASVLASAGWRSLLVEADSMLSAAGHGRAVTKDEMRELSGRIRKAYEGSE